MRPVPAIVLPALDEEQSIPAIVERCGIFGRFVTTALLLRHVRALDRKLTVFHGGPDAGPPAGDVSGGDWKKVRAGGRLVFHVTVTLAATVVCVAAEALGNLCFRGGVGLGSQTIDAALFGLLAGNLLALWLWAKAEAESR